MNRFHSKFHRKNHHTDVDVNNPDAGHDPIASKLAPFQGGFFLNGSLSASGSITMSAMHVLSGSFVGSAVLGTNGTASVKTSTTITPSSLFFLTHQTTSGTVGYPYIASRNTVTSTFTIQSTQTADRSTVAWLIVEPK
jgi:hypothetical protein